MVRVLRRRQIGVTATAIYTCRCLEYRTRHEARRRDSGTSNKSLACECRRPVPVGARLGDGTNRKSICRARYRSNARNGLCLRPVLCRADEGRRGGEERLGGESRVATRECVALEVSNAKRPFLGFAQR